MIVNGRRHAGRSNQPVRQLGYGASFEGYDLGGRLGDRYGRIGYGGYGGGMSFGQSIGGSSWSYGTRYYGGKGYPYGGQTALGGSYCHGGYGGYLHGGGSSPMAATRTAAALLRPWRLPVQRRRLWWQLSVR